MRGIGCYFQNVASPWSCLRSLELSHLTHRLPVIDYGKEQKSRRLVLLTMHKNHDLGTKLAKIQMGPQAISLAINCNTHHTEIFFNSKQFCLPTEDNYMEIFLNEVIIYFAKKY